MGNPLGVSRDFQELEERRMRAIGLWEKGETQAAVARRVGVVPQTVARWVVQYRRHGIAGLKKAGRAGRKPQMDQEDRERLHMLLLKGPKALGYKTPLWTCLRVANLIEREFLPGKPPVNVCIQRISLGNVCFTGTPQNILAEVQGRWTGAIYLRDFATPNGRPYAFLGSRRILIQKSSRLRSYLEDLKNENRLIKLADTIALLRNDEAGFTPAAVADLL